MRVESKSTIVAERLRELQASFGLTIQEMTDKCGLPKRSLENYMNVKNPQRPGVDALLAVADNLHVSIDWLVGRSDQATEPEFSTEDYAVFCHSVVLRLLGEILTAEAERPGVLEPPSRIMGNNFSDLAAWAVLDFTKVVHAQSGNPKRPPKRFNWNFDSLAKKGIDLTEGKPIADLPKRKP